MARLPALVTTYAECDGRSRKTIDWYARVARESGKLPTGKRGVGAAHMGVREAVNLILACNGAEEAKDGPRAIEKFRLYEPDPFSPTPEEIEDDEMREIGLQPTFGDALEELIRLTPYLFKIFDEDLIHDFPEISAKERFLIIKGQDCVTIEKDMATIAFRRTEYISIVYCQKGKIWESFPRISDFREATISLKFGVFLGLAKLFFEDLLQFPDELSPQSKDGGGDG